MSLEAGSNWPIKSLGEICENLDSRRVPITMSERVKGATPYYGASGVVDHVEGHLFDEELLLVSEDGANLLARTYPIAFSVTGKTWVNNHAHVLRFADDNTRRFVELYLNSISLEPFVSGMAQPKLNQRQLSRIPIPFPPMEEQKRIVELLDEAFEGLARARENAEANLYSARELFQHELDQAIGELFADGAATTFGAIASDTLIGLVRGKREQGPERQFAYLRMNGLTAQGALNLSSLVRVDCTPEEQERYSLRRGDFLFNTRNSFELVGKSAIVGADPTEPIVFNNNIMRVRFAPSACPEFVALSFLSTRVQSQLERMKSGTTSVVAIYGKTLRGLELPLPNLVRQKELADKFTKIRNHAEMLVSNYAQQLSENSNLRQSLLQKAFAGELT